MSHPSAINRYNIFVFNNCIVTMTTDFFYTHYLFSLVDSSKLLIFLVNVLYNNETRYIQRLQPTLYELFDMSVYMLTYWSCLEAESSFSLTDIFCKYSNLQVYNTFCPPLHLASRPPYSLNCIQPLGLEANMHNIMCLINMSPRMSCVSNMLLHFTCHWYW